MSLYFVPNSLFETFVYYCESVFQNQWPDDIWAINSLKLKIRILQKQWYSRLYNQSSNYNPMDWMDIYFKMIDDDQDENGKHNCKMHKSRVWLQNLFIIVKVSQRWFFEAKSIVWNMLKVIVAISPLIICYSFSISWESVNKKIEKGVFRRNLNDFNIRIEGLIEAGL